MNLEELRSVRNTERQKDSLQELRPAFYREVGEYIGNLEDERDQVAAQYDDPFSAPEVARLTDEIETAKDVAEAIYQRRMGKLVKQASLAAAGMSADSDGLTDEEASLFTDLVARIETNKEEILSVLEDGDSLPRDDRLGGSAAGPEGRDTASTPSRTDTPPTPPDDEPHSGTDATDGDEEGVDVAAAMGGDLPEASSAENESTRGDSPVGSNDDDPVDDGNRATGDASPEPDSNVDRITVQITADVGSILGVDDREYTLANEDVVTLPESNAEPLIERDAAVPLE